jgi:hypothetical protein
MLGKDAGSLTWTYGRSGWSPARTERPKGGGVGTKGYNLALAAMGPAPWPEAPQNKWDGKKEGGGENGWFLFSQSG